MTTVVFFEKPGCRNNTRQKALLEAAGHRVEARDLLTTAWTADSLRPYFGDRPVAEWFNKASPQVKDGSVRPDRLDEATALRLMIDEPLLIRRPLMEADGQRRCGFDMEDVAAWIGLGTDDRLEVETCPKSHLTDPAPCPTPRETTA